jgi:hypothetical protein
MYWFLSTVKDLFGVIVVHGTSHSLVFPNVKTLQLVKYQCMSSRPRPQHQHRHSIPITLTASAACHNLVDS